MFWVHLLFSIFVAVNLFLINVISHLDTARSPGYLTYYLMCVS